VKSTTSVTKNFILIALVAIVLSLFATDALGKVGVGMGAGEIRVTEEIKPGGIYSLPDLRVFNTGDEMTTYGMNVAYHQDNPEQRPEKTWFTFEPPTFTIAPGESELVQVTMFVPVKTNPGDYFAFLESGPVAENGAGTSVGVAVATKLYFTVVHANLWQAILFRTSSFFATYAPWSWILTGVVVLLGLSMIMRRYVSFNVSFRSKREGD
jgi:hypothetical protein